jgi:bifunctional non-homologous end joining protein LigD
MALETYRAKRDFRVTPEPGPRAREARPSRGHKKSIFVIQEHHASRLHYDFRLEADGVLKSWAVPKQPSLDPADKRLAVHVEDHPLDYASFKGRIPEGQYGAGMVYIWDKGTYENLSTVSIAKAIDAGRLEVLLHGKKLKGRFALVRMRKDQSKGKDNWLLIKMRDGFARSSNGHVETTTVPAKGSRRRAGGSAAKPRASKAGSTFEFTHTDKILFPDSGITKGDVLQFYSRIAPRLLPFLRDRPMTLERLPEGLSGPDSPRFWQKDTPNYYPKWIPRVDLETERGKTVHYALVNSLQTLLYLVNQGALTFHTWLSRVPDLDRPDFVLFDLDPGPAAFSEVVAVALVLQKKLKHQRRPAFLKTTGKSGLHVLVPWEEKGGYDEAREWAREVGAQVVAEMPERATIEIRKANRGKRVYVDTMQNARGHHAVPPYVLRAVPAATISMPLSWKELTPDLDPARFTIKTVLRRLARQKKDPFGPLVQLWS